MLRTDEYNRTCVLTIDGDLAGDDAAALRRAVEAVLTAGKLSDVVVDLEKTEFIDSAGLESLVWARRQLDAADGRLKLAGLDEHCRKIFEITRLAPQFECHADVAAAMKN